MFEILIEVQLAEEGSGHGLGLGAFSAMPWSLVFVQSRDKCVRGPV